MACVLACGLVFAAPKKSAKYVFLFIGDGMSIPQRMMVSNYLKALGKPDLAINKMPDFALTTTFSASSLITDSAAAATAIACGEKTKNGMVGVAPDGKKLVSIAEIAKKTGRKVGIITSVTLNHATPAGFYAKNQSRGAYYEIALELLDSGFDYFGGGGVGSHDDKKSKAYKGDIYDLARESGYNVAIGRDDFAKISGGKTIAVENKGGAIPYFIDKPDTLRISDFLKKGIELLDNPRGFFFMVEGGKIDWMCHANDAATTLMEIEDFNRAVEVAIDFAKKRPNETLIVVTGDHETGGLSLGFAGTGYSLYMDRLALQKASRDAFKDKAKRLMKKGEGFGGAQELLAESFGFDFSDDKKNHMRLHSAEREELKKYFESGDADKFANAALRIFNNRAGIAWTSTAHTALPVITSASGVRSGEFKGFIDNTDIPKIIAKILKGNP